MEWKLARHCIPVSLELGMKRGRDKGVPTLNILLCSRGTVVILDNRHDCNCLTSLSAVVDAIEECGRQVSSKEEVGGGCDKRRRKRRRSISARTVERMW